MTRIAVLLLLVVGLGPCRLAPGAAPASPGVGRPMPIAVRDGHASFDLPASGRDGKTLVIVSALGDGVGPFPIRLSTRAVAKARPAEVLPDPVGSLPLRDAPHPGPIPAAPATIPPSVRSFHLLAKDGDVTQAASYGVVEGHLRAYGLRVQVYVDKDDVDRVDVATLRDVVATFDEKIYPVAALRFGVPRDVDGDGRFTVLFSGWLAKLAGGKVSLDGFTRGADLDLVLPAPLGNRCDMMYLNTTLKAGPHLRTVMAHEYTHAITFSRKVLAPAARGVQGTEEEGWLDEALAHLVEDAHGFSRSNLDYRVSAYLSQPERYRLVVDDYYGEDLFRSHGNRGATYLFLRWCVDRYGPGLLDALIRSERRGRPGLEAATGMPFAELFRRWTVALYTSGLDPAADADGSYRSIDPRAELEDWILAGPRASTVRPGGLDLWDAGGTTAHYAIVAGAAGEATRVEIDGPAAADMQVTAVSLPPGLGRPELTVRPAMAPGGTIGFRASVVERDGTPIRLGALAWEPLVPASNPRAAGFGRGGIDMLGIARAFGTSALPARGTLASRPIPMAGVLDGQGPLVFKAVGTDSGGRRVAAWAIMAPHPGRETNLSSLNDEE
ncbi:hypothetical protein TA3x_004957 [Tundrisphaera sp. TA3]|uniref:hypothetical protein n=1 Tax=Tundrisphaera sp. TA3 TaxID=3435775 RepID=UPI003EB80C03